MRQTEIFSLTSCLAEIIDGRRAACAAEAFDWNRFCPIFNYIHVALVHGAQVPIFEKRKIPHQAQPHQSVVLPFIPTATHHPNGT